MTKKVLFITNNYPAPDYKRLWKKALSLVSDGYEVRIICPAGARRPGKRRLNGVSIYYFKKVQRNGGLFSFLMGELSSLLRVGLRSLGFVFTWRFKAIHVMNPTDTLGILGAFYGMLGSRFVFEVNEAYVRRFEDERLKNKKKGGWMAGFLQALERFCLKASDLVIVPDYKQKARVRRAMGEKKRPVITVEPLPDLKDFYQPYLDRDYKKGFPHMALYAGSLRVERGIIKLLRSIDFIVNKTGRRDILFVLAGEGQDIERIRTYAKNRGLVGYIHFTGWLSQNKLLSYLADADMGLMPEPARQGNPALRDSVLEYLAMGKPVVYLGAKSRESRIGRAGAFVEDESEITFAREIIRVIDNKEKSLAMGEMGKLRVERDLNWIKSEIKLVSAYDRLLNPRPTFSNSKRNLLGRAA